MGWWDMGEGGASFTSSSEDSKNQMVWGDGPADVIDDAIQRVTIEFLRDYGRMPSKREVINGIMFSTNVLDGLAEEPKDAPVATKAQCDVIDDYGYIATGGDVALPENRRDAWKRVMEVMQELSVEDE